MIYERLPFVDLMSVTMSLAKCPSCLCIKVGGECRPWLKSFSNNHKISDALQAQWDSLSEIAVFL